MAVRLVDPSVLVNGAPVDLFEVVGSTPAMPHKDCSILVE